MWCASNADDTATLFGLTDRGTIEVGKKADINVIDLAALTLHPARMAYDLPAGGRRLVQSASGYTATVVSGTVTRRDSADTGCAAGPPGPRRALTGFTLRGVAASCEGEQKWLRSMDASGVTCRRLGRSRCGRGRYTGASEREPGASSTELLPTESTAVPIATSPGHVISPRKSSSSRAMTNELPGSISGLISGVQQFDPPGFQCGRQRRRC